MQFSNRFILTLKVKDIRHHTMLSLKLLFSYPLKKRFKLIKTHLILIFLQLNCNSEEIKATLGDSK